MILINDSSMNYIKLNPYLILYTCTNMVYPCVDLSFLKLPIVRYPSESSKHLSTIKVLIISLMNTADKAVT